MDKKGEPNLVFAPRNCTQSTSPVAPTVDPIDFPAKFSIHYFCMQPSAEARHKKQWKRPKNQAGPLYIYPQQH